MGYNECDNNIKYKICFHLNIQFIILIINPNLTPDPNTTTNNKNQVLTLKYYPMRHPKLSVEN